ncbi:SemiSWEET transporter [Vibrio artabrorum]|uniref:SemiSWEET transporter n=1 Tax=Vibrio artabrorum TaxID=446374 RepID=UPI00355343AE
MIIEKTTFLKYGLLMPSTSLIISLTAAFLTTISFIPQAIQTIRTRDTSGISLPMYILFIIGTSLWMAYGWLSNDPAIFIGNSLITIFIIPILYLKFTSILKK